MSAAPRMTDEQWEAYKRSLVFKRTVKRNVPVLRRPRWRQIAQEVADKYELFVNDVVGRSQRRRIIHARHEFFFRVYVELKVPYSEMGRVLDRDHTTVRAGVLMHALRHRLFLRDDEEVPPPNKSRPPKVITPVAPPAPSVMDLQETEEDLWEADPAVRRQAIAKRAARGARAALDAMGAK